MKATLKEYAKPVVVTLVALVLSFFLHLKWCGTTMSLSEEIWQKMLEFHLTWYPFSIRYFTSYSVLFLQNAFSLPVRESFFMLQFSLAFVLALVFYRYLRVLSFSQQQSTVGVFLLLSSYPILCAHFEPVHTWDDFWSYLFVTMAVTSVIRGKLGAGMVYFTLGCFAREQTLLFYPVLVVAAGWFSKDVSPLRRTLWLLSPLIVYGAFYGALWQNPDPKRFELIRFNFEHSLRTRDTIFSLFISFGFIWLASATALVRAMDANRGKVSRLLFWGALFTGPATVALTLFFTFARETRIFFPPFIFLLPLALVELTSAYSFIKKTKPLGRRMIQIALFGLLMAIGFLLGKLAFPYFEYRSCGRFAQQWAGLHFGLILNLAAFYITRIVIRYRAGDT